MKVTYCSDALELSSVPETVPLANSTGKIVFTIIAISRQTHSLGLWPTPGAAPNPDQSCRRGEWSAELESHFHALRRRARATCPLPMLPMFEEQLSEIEATVRGTVTGRLSPFVDWSQHIRQVEEFSKTWVPYIDPPPPRLRCDESNRSVWVDGRCIAAELKREEFEYFRALVKAYPNTLAWRLVTNTVPGFRGKNQTRFKCSLPDAVRNLIETTATGSVIRLPEKLSKTV